jgi:hypothetical protein
MGTMLTIYAVLLLLLSAALLLDTGVRAAAAIDQRSALRTVVLFLLRRGVLVALVRRAA